MRSRPVFRFFPSNVYVWMFKLFFFVHCCYCYFHGHYLFLISHWLIFWGIFFLLKKKEDISYHYICWFLFHLNPCYYYYARKEKERKNGKFEKLWSDEKKTENHVYIYKQQRTMNPKLNQKKNDNSLSSTCILFWFFLSCVFRWFSFFVVVAVVWFRFSSYQWNKISLFFVVDDPYDESKKKLDFLSCLRKKNIESKYIHQTPKGLWIIFSQLTSPAPFCRSVI